MNDAAVRHLEEKVLDDLLQRTGYKYVHICGIDTTCRQVAERLLPILRDWTDKVDNGRIRHALYSRFHTRFADPFLDDLLRWWRNEQDELLRDSLTQTLTLLAKPRDGEAIWSACKARPPKHFYGMLLVRLATFPALEREIKETVIASLLNNQLSPSDLHDVAKMKDVRVREWFKSNIDSPDPQVAAIARRVVAVAKLPLGVRTSRRPPDREFELFSAEIDISDLPLALGSLEETFKATVPKDSIDMSFISLMKNDTWIVLRITGEGSASFDLWFRKEDVDIVEIVLMPAS